MNSKLRIKFGAIEIDYEGTDEFIKTDLMPLLIALQDLQLEPSIDDNNDQEDDASDDNGSSADGDGMSTSSIAQKLNASTGPDLVKAAVAYLTFSKKKVVMTRKEILKEMKSAEHVYKQTFGNNLGASLSSLVTSKVLNPQGAGSYSLNKPAREALEALLAK
jgi:hypothetical protein